MIIYLIYIVLICLILHFVRKFLAKFKIPKVGSIAVFTGGVKTGKSAVSLACAMSVYHRQLRSYKWAMRFYRLKQCLRLKNLVAPIEPLFYSSIPLAVPYTPLTRDILLMRERVAPKSVVFIDEVSLIADSMLFKDNEINAQLLKFFKLFGHISHGGLCVFNSHCISDLHFALKRTTSQYFYIHSTVKLPFVSFTRMREERYSEDGTTINNYAEDVENSVRTCLFRSRTFKLYDCYTYSPLTDNLPIKSVKVKAKDLKSYDIPSFNPVFSEAFGKIKKEKYFNEK